MAGNASENPAATARQTGSEAAARSSKACKTAGRFETSVVFAMSLERFEMNACGTVELDSSNISSSFASRPPALPNTAARVHLSPPSLRAISTSASSAPAPRPPSASAQWKRTFGSMSFASECTAIFNSASTVAGNIASATSRTSGSRCRSARKRSGSRNESVYLASRISETTVSGRSPRSKADVSGSANETGCCSTNLRNAVCRSQAFMLPRRAIHCSVVCCAGMTAGADAPFLRTTRQIRPKPRPLSKSVCLRTSSGR